jgi:hypothetical protein
MAQVIAARQNVTDGNGVDDQEPPDMRVFSPVYYSN